MKRVEFRLSMPGRASWDGKWSGDDGRYVIIRTLTDKRALELLLLPNGETSWAHRWNDGWTARVTARLMAVGERLPKSDGFCGYEWMVDNILRYRDTRRPEAVPA